MRRSSLAVISALALVLGAVLAAPPLLAATPASGTLSKDTPTVTWSGTILTSNPTDFCFTADPACDRFSLTVVPPTKKAFLVDIRITAANAEDDLDLFVIGPDGRQYARSATGSGHEEVTLYSPPAGTYEVQVLSFLSFPAASYSGTASFDLTIPDDTIGGAFRGTLVGPDFAGVPANQPAGAEGGGLRVRATYIGHEAAEPTIGVTQRSVGFYAAGQFDVLGNLARTDVMRSRDGNRTWQVVQPALPVGDTTSPPTTLDPYLYVDPDTGRVFNFELYVACMWLNTSDDEGQTWRTNPFACGEPVADHQTIVTAKPRSGLVTVGYPNVAAACVNRVGDSPCYRSVDGGATWLAGGDAFLGFDPAAGGFCGGLHGHLQSDPEGRLFLPKGHCGFPWIAISEDNGSSWTRVKIEGHLRLPHHEVSAAADAAGNVFAIFWDSTNRLPYLSHSTDHGRTWSTPRMIAPPGVFEVNFPTISAGDAGRIAITFPGSTSPTRTTDRPWNSYLVVTTNALEPDPLFVWTTANDPADPVHRGNCGPGRCAGMFDFLDVQTSPADGSFWATAVDTCTNSCVTATGDWRSDAMDGIAIRQVGGPSLWAPGHRPPK